MRYVLLTLAFLNCALALAQTTPQIEWQRCLGGGARDEGYALIQDPDGNYVVAASTFSVDGDVVAQHGGGEMWVVKMDPVGAIIWAKTYGGSGGEGGFNICESSDGGYLVLGTTSSNDGDVSEHHGLGDIWAVRLDLDGNIIWERAFGGSLNEEASGLTATADGGFLISGQSPSIDGDLTTNQGGWDAWVLKLDATGNLEWQRSIGGSGMEILLAIQQTSDGGSISTGFTTSNNGDIIGNHGLFDMLVLKLSATGETQWQRILGGTGNEGGNAVAETTDGGFIVLGSADMNDGDVSGNHSNTADAWLVRLNSTGDLLWQNCYGGTAYDNGTSIQTTEDGGFAFLGSTYSTNGDVTTTNGALDFWLVRTNEIGQIQWQRTMGGGLEDQAQKIIRTVDGGFAAIGSTKSNNFDVSGYHGGEFDCWIVKLSADPTSIQDLSSTFNIAIFPNPTHGDETITYTLERAALVQVEIHDVEGKLISTISSGIRASGPHILALPLTKLPSGNYFVALRVDGKVVVRKVSKV